jgi:hypothetical protein
MIYSKKLGKVPTQRYPIQPICQTEPSDIRFDKFKYKNPKIPPFPLLSNVLLFNLSRV